MTHVHDRHGKPLCGADPSVTSVSLAFAQDRYARWELGKWIGCLRCCEAVRRSATTPPPAPTGEGEI